MAATTSAPPLIVFESEPVPLHADAVSELPEISHLDSVLQDQTALRQHVRGRIQHEHQLRQQQTMAAAAAATASSAQLSTSSAADKAPNKAAAHADDAAVAEDPTRYTENEETDSSSRRKRRHARFAANPVSSTMGAAAVATSVASAPLVPTLGERVRYFLSRNRYLIVAVVLVVAVLCVGALYYVRCQQEERLRALQSDRAGEARAEELLQRRQDERLQAMADEKALVEHELERHQRAAATMARTYEQQIAEQHEQQREQLEQMRRLQAYQQAQEERLQAYDELMRDYEDHLRAAEAHASAKVDDGGAPSDHERVDAADGNEPLPASGIVSPKPVYATTGSASPTHVLVSGSAAATHDEHKDGEEEEEEEEADTPSRSVPPWHSADDDQSDQDDETTGADETQLQQAPLGESGV